MSFGDYLGSKTIPLCIGGMGILYLILIAYLCGIPFLPLALLLPGAVFFVVLYLIISWHRVDKRLHLLQNQLESLKDRYLIGEMLDRPRDAVELEYYLLMKEISRLAIGAVEQAQKEKQDYFEYVEQWVHEMKTPLTACSLILANGGEFSRLRKELRRADNLTESILTYAKLRTPEKDMQINSVHLHSACDQAVREEMELLIAAGISVTIDGQGESYTDPKLLVFILKQLLINCAKYCPGCQVRMEISGNCLCFTDNGPGIPSHELCRVTERGFTGSAGRHLGVSTGMGLYIVSQLCRNLNIQMEIQSKEGEFTRFVFRFPAPTLQN